MRRTSEFDHYPHGGQDDDDQNQDDLDESSLVAKMMIKIRMMLMTMMTKCNVLCEDKTSISNYAKSWVTYST